MTLDTYKIRFDVGIFQIDDGSYIVMIAPAGQEFWEKNVLFTARRKDLGLAITTARDWAYQNKGIVSTYRRLDNRG